MLARFMLSPASPQHAAAVVAVVVPVPEHKGVEVLCRYRTLELVCACTVVGALPDLPSFSPWPVAV